MTGVCRSPDAAGRVDVATARTLLAAGTGPAWCYELAGGRHFNFSNYGASYLSAASSRWVPSTVNWT